MEQHDAFHPSSWNQKLHVRCSRRRTITVQARHMLGGRIKKKRHRSCRILRGMLPAIILSWCDAIFFFWHNRQKDEIKILVFETHWFLPQQEIWQKSELKITNLKHRVQLVHCCVSELNQFIGKLRKDCVGARTKMSSSWEAGPVERNRKHGRVQQQREKRQLRFLPF